MHHRLPSSSGVGLRQRGWSMHPCHLDRVDPPLVMRRRISLVRTAHLSWIGSRSVSWVGQP
jgi:hypothetical protein